MKVTYNVQKLLCLYLCLIAMLSFVGCAKEKKEKQPTTLSQEDAQEIKDLYNQIEMELLKQNKSLDDSFIVIPDYIEDDISIYAYIDKPNISFNGDNYVYTTLSGSDKNNNSYTYMFYKNKEDLKLVDFFLSMYLRFPQEDTELINLGETMVYSYGDKFDYCYKYYTINYDDIIMTYYMVGIQLSDEESFVAFYQTFDDDILNEDEVFNILMNGITLSY